MTEKELVSLLAECRKALEYYGQNFPEKSPPANAWALRLANKIRAALEGGVAREKVGGVRSGPRKVAPILQPSLERLKELGEI